ncbi:MAG: hypothetical protein AAGJ83_09520, partial [Planctomycetota bacterium]
LSNAIARRIEGIVKQLPWPGPVTVPPGIAEDAAFQLAVDEACLLAADGGEISESFRLWEFRRPVVVLGRSSQHRLETDFDECGRLGVGIYRRCSGGASIVGGPGCLMYSVVLSHQSRPSVSTIGGAHNFVMESLLAAVRRQLPETRRDGICDLVWHECKFSGNALRVARSHTLYHGTLLYDYDVDLIERCLAYAPRQPEYRRGRNHESFVTNAPLQLELLRNHLAETFSVSDVFSASSVESVILPRAKTLVAERYKLESWRFKR